MTVRAATPADAELVGALLDAFNREFDVDTPGPSVLAGRLRGLLDGPTTLAFLAGTSGVAVVTLRTNVWYDGPVGLLDELYVVPDQRNHGLGTALLQAAEEAVRLRGGELLEINVDGDDIDARRFYERHGYTNVEPGAVEPSFYYWRSLTG